MLPILAATVLNGGENVIHRCPHLNDVEATVKILKHLGCQVHWEGDTLYVNSRHITRHDIPENLMREMRSSVIFLGAIAARCGEVHVSAPGGCEIGARPIDLHLKALREMGMEIREEHGYISGRVAAWEAKEIHLSFPSVGATENIMMAASGVSGVTVINNAAREPEIRDLAEYLGKIGVRVEGAGCGTVKIVGTDRFSAAEHTVMPDRIVTATYLCAAMVSKSNMEITSARSEDLKAVTALLRECGARLWCEKDRILIEPPRKMTAVDRIQTQPYPGFPTDAQSLFLAMLCTARGTSIITETIFENRFKNVEHLMRMGASIRVDGRTAVVRGVDELCGAHVSAPDLRGGASLVIAALGAEGETVIDDAHHIERGYENIVELLREAGADIKRAE